MRSNAPTLFLHRTMRHHLSLLGRIDSLTNSGWGITTDDDDYSSP